MLNFLIKKFVIDIGFECLSEDIERQLLEDYTLHGFVWSTPYSRKWIFRDKLGKVEYHGRSTESPSMAKIQAKWIL